MRLKVSGLIPNSLPIASIISCICMLNPLILILRNLNIKSSEKLLI
ncbi:hypothetical protein ACPWXF_000010 [Campylobacter coli]|nr:hypothetical protein [Campylobacter coli]EGG1581366.1 hypothetical protein [Campylobacter coli]EGX7751700.1 hypothetical protein [Campylobacter coli]EIA6442295.1 hypothetical protein [Campylobacter coli]EIX1431512.1 hypothetical protein [Campylobacter coli]